MINTLFLDVPTLKFWMIIILPTDRPEIILATGRTQKNKFPSPYTGFISIAY